MNPRILQLILKMKDDASKVLQGFAAKGASALRVFARRAKVAFGNLAGGVQTLFRALTSLRTLLVTGIAAIAIRRVVSAFADFQKSMNRVGALTGAVGEQFQMLNAFAQELGRTTVFSAKEAADGMALLAQAGLEADEIMSAIPRVLTLAASAQLEMADAAEIATNVLFQLQIPINELGAANDVLVKTFTSSKTSLQSLGEAFKFVGPLAKSAGQDFKEITTVLGQLGQVGFEGSLGGTAFRNAIIRLVNPSREAQKVLDRLGIQILDTSGNMLQFTKIIEQFEGKVVSTADITKIFGARAGPAFAALVSRGSGALREFRAELEGIEGIADEIAERQLAGLTGELIIMRSALNGAAIALGEKFEPVFIKGAKTVRQLANGVVVAADVLVEMTSALQDSLSVMEIFNNFVAPFIEFLVRGFFRVQRAVLLIRAAFNSVLIVGAGLRGIFGELLTVVGALGVAVVNSFLKPLEGTIFVLERVAFALGADGLAGSLRTAKREIKEAASASSALLKPGLDILDSALEDTSMLAHDVSSSLDAIKESAIQEELAIDRLTEAKEKLNDAMRNAQAPATELLDSLRRFGTDSTIQRIASGEVLDFTRILDARTAEEAQQVVNALQSALILTQATFDEQRVQTFLFLLDSAKQRLAELGGPAGEGISPQEDPRVLMEKEVLAEIAALNSEFASSNLEVQRRAMLLEGKEREAFLKSIVAFEKNTAQRRLGIASTFLEAGIKLAELGGRKTAGLAKKLALAQAIVDGVAAVQKALANPPGWPFNAGQVAAVSALQAANVATIASTAFGQSSAGGTGGFGGGGGSLGVFGGGGAGGASLGLGAGSLVDTSATAAAAPRAQDISITIDGAVVMQNQDQFQNFIADVLRQATGEGNIALSGG